VWVSTCRLGEPTQPCPILRTPKRHEIGGSPGWKPPNAVLTIPRSFNPPRYESTWVHGEG